jgi:hypothetical protein
VHTLITVWRSYDWKSHIDWKPSRKTFVARSIHQVSRWGELAKRIGCESMLKERVARL